MSASTQALHFFVPTIVCSGCALTLENAAADPSILSVEVDLIENLLIVTPNKGMSIDIAALEKRCEDVGHSLIRNQYYGYKALLTGTLGFTLFAFCASGYVMPMLAMYFTAAMSSLIILYIGYDIYFRAFNEIRKLKKLRMNSLLAVSTLSLWIISLISLCLPVLGLPLFFDTILMIFFFFYLGIIIKNYAKKTIQQPNLLPLTQKETLVVSNYSEESNEQDFKYQATLTKDLIRNQYIFVKKGEIIPVDCTIEKQVNNTIVHDGIRSGRDLKQTELEKFKKDGTLLLAGIEVTEGGLYLKVSATEQDSALAKLDKKLKEIKRSKTLFQSTIDNKIIGYTAPTILLFAIITGCILGFLYTPLLGIQIGLSLLVAICPCMIALIIPLMIKIVQYHALKNNFIIQNNEALEYKKIMFAIDIHGTLTYGKPTVSEESSTADIIENINILKIFYIIEKDSSHRIGLSISDFIKNKCPQELISEWDQSILAKEPTESKMEEIEETEKIINDEYYAVGDTSKIIQYGLKSENLKTYMRENKLEKIDAHIIFLIHGKNKEDTNKEIMGHMVLKDRLRPDAKEFLRQLKQRNISYKIITGSDEINSQHFTSQLDIEEKDLKNILITSCSNKKQATDKLKKEHPNTCIFFIGNDLNDLEAMSDCISIAVDSAHPRVISSAHVLLQTISLMPIIKFLDLSEQFSWYVKFTLILNFLCNIASVSTPLILLFTIGFVLNPAWVAGLVILQLVLVFSCVGCFYYRDLSKAGEFKQSKKAKDNLDKLMHSEIYTKSGAKKPSPSPSLPVRANRQGVVVGEAWGQGKDPTRPHPHPLPL